MKNVVQLVNLLISEFSASSQLYPFCSYTPLKYPNLHMALRSVPKLRARVKSDPALNRKNLKKKVSVMLPIMATTKKNSTKSEENWIFGNAEKNAFFHKVLSRVPKLQVGTVSRLLSQVLKKYKKCLKRWAIPSFKKILLYIGAAVQEKTAA